MRIYHKKPFPTAKRNELFKIGHEQLKMSYGDIAEITKKPLTRQRIHRILYPLKPNYGIYNKSAALRNR